MTDRVILRGYRYSVYNRIARMVLHEKGVAYEIEEVDPFSPPLPDDYQRRHPFGRVPVLSHGDVDVYETMAITRYVDAAFKGPALTPRDPLGAARMVQVISIVDSYGYWPMVRQVFAQRVFAPMEGRVADEAMIEEGLEKSALVLAALERLAEEGLVLSEGEISLADCHLAPMLAYFTAAPEGRAALSAHTGLSRWWTATSLRRSMTETAPRLAAN